MHLHAYKSAYHSFYRLVVIQLGLTCPSRCRHCSVFAGPKRPERMAPERAIAIVRSFAELDEANVVMLTGGEPFTLRPALDAALAEVARHDGLTAYVVTSASWASSESEARAILFQLAPIGGMIVSADAYHEEFIELARVRHAIAAGLDRGISITLSIALDEGDERFLNRVRDAVGPALWKAIELEVLPVHPTGRAKASGIGDFRTVPEPLPDGACDLLGAPVFIHSGKAVACCQIDAVNEAHRKDQSPYLLGSIESSSVAEIRERVDGDLVLQGLRTHGPRRLIELLAEHGYQPKLGPKYPGICFLCRDLMGDGAAVELLHTLLAEPMRAREIHLARMLQYGEIRPCPRA